MNDTPFSEAINHETIFTRSQPQGHYKIFKNIRRVVNLISKSKQESKRVPSHIAEISDPSMEGKDLLKSVMIRGTEEVKLGDRK